MGFSKDMNSRCANSRWGVGPTFGMVTAAYMLVVAGLTCRFPGLFEIRQVSRLLLWCAAIALGVSGLAIYVWSLMLLNRALKTGRLITVGPYAVVRHPVYAAWILLILPSIALALASWPLLAAPVVAYVSFKALITREDRVLDNAFGDEYRNYRKDVPEIFPVTGKKRRTTSKAIGTV